jgi:anhydro-N-acetylmuramic acid kinase
LSAKFFGAGSWRVLGLMSGTSLDSLDGALMQLERDETGLKSWRLLEHRESAIPAGLRTELEALIRGEARTAAQWAELHVALARTFAEFVLSDFPVMENGLVADLAGFPGQTIYHDPQGMGLSFQLGSPAAFATLTGIDTVGEFRLPDVLLGGEGAPLVPLADALLHRALDEYRVLINIGGIANLTLLPPGQGLGGVLAWDTGPGNTLLDLACSLAFGEHFDRDGEHSAAGDVDRERLSRWLSHPWFSRRPPKSTGRELFGGTFLGPTEMERELQSMGAENALATLVELTVGGIVGALDGISPDRVFVSGGGTSNDHLMSRLRESLAPVPLDSSSVLGLPPAAKEAADFALLALEAAAGRQVALPAVTGARTGATAGLFSPGGGTGRTIT